MSKKKQALIALAAAATLILSLGTYRSESISNSTACATVNACEGTHTSEKGTKTTQQWGFPAVYRTTETFRPYNTTHYKEATTESQQTDIVLIAINLLFFSMLFMFISQLYVKTRRTPIKH